jgi:4-carboxymuconolactone decarboxylase
MKTVTTAIALALSLGAGDALAQSVTGALSAEEVRTVSPALERYAEETLAKGLWVRPGLAPRDRSIATLTVAIARNQSAILPDQIRLALDNGVSPAELSEIITHLAFYSGWGNAIAATASAREVFAARGITADKLPAASPELLPLDQESESKRVVAVEQNIGSAAPGLVQDTTDVLFKDLWLRPGLAPRDRSFVTVSALIANGQSAQIAPHLNRALDNGLTTKEAGELVSHLAYYAGWPNAFSAAAIAREVFDKRAKN